MVLHEIAAILQNGDEQQTKAGRNEAGNGRGAPELILLLFA